MSHGGSSLWFEVAFYATVGAVCLVPVGALVELVAAVFSRRVRHYIVKHPVAHAVWFACALFLALLLIPAPSTPRHRKERCVNTPLPNQPVEREGVPHNRMSSFQPQKREAAAQFATGSRCHPRGVN